MARCGPVSMRFAPVSRCGYAGVVIRKHAAALGLFGSIAIADCSHYQVRPNPRSDR